MKPKDLKYIWERNKELGSIGSMEQYAEYLKQVYPQSVFKEPLWHSSTSIFDKFDPSFGGKGHTKELGQGFYLSKEKGSWNHYAKTRAKDFEQVHDIAFMVNAKRSLTVKDYSELSSMWSKAPDFDPANYVDAIVTTRDDQVLLTTGSDTYTSSVKAEHMRLGGVEDRAKFKEYVSNEGKGFSRNPYRVLDVETNSLNPSVNSIVDLGIADFNKQGVAQKSSVVRFLTEEQMAEARMTPAGKFASYAEAKDITSSVVGAADAGRFKTQAIIKALTEEGSPKVMWIKNLPFESRQFSSHLSAADMESMADKFVGTTDWAIGKGRIEHFTTVDIIKQQSLTKELHQAYLADPSQANKIKLRESHIELMNKTVYQGFVKKQDKRIVLDADAIARGLLAKAEEQGLVPDLGGNYVSGTSADALMAAFKAEGVSHAAKGDVLQEGGMLPDMMKIYQEMHSATGASEETKRGFRRLAAIRSEYHGKYDVVGNYVNTLIDFKSNIDPTTGRGFTTNIKGPLTQAKGNVYRGVSGTETLRTSFKQNRTIRNIDLVGEHFVGRGMEEEWVGKLKDLSIPELEQVKVNISGFKKEVIGTVIRENIDNTEQLQKILSSSKKANIMESVIGRVPPKVPWKAIGIGAAAFAALKILTGGRKEREETDANVVVERDVERMLAISPYDAALPGRPSKIGSSQEDIARSYYASAYGLQGQQDLTAADIGTEMHKVLEEKYRKEGILTESEVAVADLPHNVTGSVDWFTPKGSIADIKTVKAEKYAQVAVAKQAFKKNVSQLNYYATLTGKTKGNFLRYVSQDDPEQYTDVPVDYDPETVRDDLYKLKKARVQAAKMIARDFNPTKRKPSLFGIHHKDSDPQQHYKY